MNRPNTPPAGRSAAHRSRALRAVRLRACWPLLRPRLVVTPARADLQILITKGVTDPIPIAIVPFARAVPADGGFDVAAVVQHDLEGSGRFRAMQRRDMLTHADQRQRGAGGRLEGRRQRLRGRRPRQLRPSASELDVECDLINIQTGTRVASQKFIADAASLRNAAHLVSDFIYGKILGVRGAFATRIAYVAVQGSRRASVSSSSSPTPTARIPR